MTTQSQTQSDVSPPPTETELHIAKELYLHWSDFYNKSSYTTCWAAWDAITPQKRLFWVTLYRTAVQKHFLHKRLAAKEDYRGGGYAGIPPATATPAAAPEVAYNEAAVGVAAEDAMTTEEAAAVVGSSAAEGGGGSGGKKKRKL